MKLWMVVIISLVVLVKNSAMLASTGHLSSGMCSDKDVVYGKACGPIACYVAVRALAVPTTLTTMINGCQWKPGQLTTLEMMQSTLSKIDGVACVACRLTPDKLCALLRNNEGVAILPIRKRSQVPDHVVVAIGVVGDQVMVMDYPELSETVPMSVLVDVWDGPALVVARRSQQTYNTLLTHRRTTIVASILAEFVVVFLLYRARWSRAKKIRIVQLGHSEEV
jgi:hypothetical protein